LNVPEGIPNAPPFKAKFEFEAVILLAAALKTPPLKANCVPLKETAEPAQANVPLDCAKKLVSPPALKTTAAPCVIVPV
jgi:hypothetical protein